MNTDSLDGYFREAASWDENRREMQRRSERRAWQVAAAGWLSAMAASAALAMLMPLKRVDPFVVRVDSSTGIVDVVPAYKGGAVLEQAVTRYFLSHYVATCERFNYATAESDYEECGAFHSVQRNQAWFALWNSSNPASPLNLHKDGSSVRVQVESVSFFERASGADDLAQVRYLKVESHANGTAERVTHWISTIQYAYGAPSQDPRVRRWNPLGFRILELTAEPEVIAPPPQSPAKE
ncbi:MAG: hypothetical protein JSR36_09835 [Proteobacteria bacterium]|nr:hypothetical protein [Pseudomonadota bacterium]